MPTISVNGEKTNWNEDVPVKSGYNQENGIFLWEGGD